jgi:DNA-binding MarR family transcriptional regulator
MTDLDRHALHELDILRHVEDDPRLSNRMAARKLGVSLKLAHELLKRMVKKGFLHVQVINSRRWEYFLTPKGIAEQTRLTLEFLDFSMRFYREARRRSSQVCRDLAEAGHRRTVFVGSGDLAEIVYLGVQEWGLELEAVYAPGEGTFMGLTIRPLTELSNRLPAIVCMYDAAQPMRRRYLPPGVPSFPGFHWVFE